MNLRNRSTSFDGFDRVSELLSRSHSAHLFLTVFPALVQDDMHIMSCYSDTLGFVAAAGFATATCAIPDPLCPFALLALAAAGSAMEDSCGPMNLDNTIGWG